MKSVQISPATATIIPFEEQEMLLRLLGSNFSLKDDMDIGLMELRFLEMFSLCLTSCEEQLHRHGAGKYMDLDLVMIDIETAVTKDSHLTALDESSEVENWDSGASSFLEKYEHLKPKIKEICAVLLDCSSTSVFCTSDETIIFIDSMLWNLNDLVRLKADTINVSVKNQIGVLKIKLDLLRQLVNFTAQRCFHQLKNLMDFLDYLGDWLIKAACISLLYWLDGEDESRVKGLETMLFDLIRKIKPCSPKVVAIYIGVLRSFQFSGSDNILIVQIVNFLLEDLVEMAPMKEYSRILGEGLLFLISFIMDSPGESEVEAGNVLFTQTNVLIKEVVTIIGSIYMDDMEKGLSMERRISLSSFEYKISKLMEEVKELYVQIPNSLILNFTMTQGQRYFDAFLGHLKEVLQCKAYNTLFVDQKVATVQEEMLSLKPFLIDNLKLQNEHENPIDLWKRVSFVTYQAKCGISSCSTMNINPLWHDIVRLASVFEEIKLIKLQVKNINEEVHNARMTSGMMYSGHLLTMQANTSRFDAVVVGLEDELQTIIDRLTRGTKQLDIVSITGMPGLGKTTLAQKVYNEPAVKYYFDRCAWCCVSQVYKSRELLFDILCDLTGSNARVSNPNASDDKLAELLWKSLKGHRYIIVMDDIWDIGAWDSLKLSLPDDGNGSRILFTTRIHNLALQAKANCNPHSLRTLSDEESWKLLQEKLFHEKDGCPSYLSEIGKRIAQNCKGLPLAVVLVAGILAKTNMNFFGWRKIEESVGSKIATEGCMEVLELSYKHLPDPLRPCFLYFGAFPEDRVIRVRKLMNLWIAEGFIPRTELKSLHEVAEDYLIDLIDRSLVTVTERSSKGGIKTCGVHDLLRDLCLAKVQEEKFLKWVKKQDFFQYWSSPKRYDGYRLCLDGGWTDFIDSTPSSQSVHSVLLFGYYESWQRHSNPSAFFTSFKLLNVLDLECIYLDCSFPEEVTSLIDLRYLALWCCTKYLPSSISNLVKLETLIVKGETFHIPLPDTFWKMKSLRHVHILGLYFSGYEHDETCQLDNIDTFSTPTLDSRCNIEKLLRRLPGLRKLSCTFFEPQFDDMKPIEFPTVTSQSVLESLKLYSYGLALKKKKKMYSFSEVLPGENHRQFPSLIFPITLRKLTLGRFGLPWSAMSFIGKLPNLEVLKLQAQAFSGKIWDMEDGDFLNLKFLQLWQLDIEQWNVCSEPFPSLEQLVVKECPLLEQIPNSLGDIPTLKKMEVRWCIKAANSARRILEEQHDIGNYGLEVLLNN